MTTTEPGFDWGLYDRANSLYNDAAAVHRRAEKGLAPFTRYSYTNARTNARSAYTLYSALNMDLEAAKAWALFIQLDRLASL